MKAAIALLVVSSAAAYQNQAIVDAVNANPVSTWKAGHNSRLAGMSLDDIRSLLGTQISNRSKTRPSASFVHDVSLPDTFDSRSNWPNCPTIKMIRDQGNCGDCWAFGAAESFSDRYCIASGQTQSYVFSPFALMTCSNLNMGCNGGNLATAWDFIEMHGLPLDECQPYVGVNGSTPACQWGTCTGSGSWDTWAVSSTTDPGCGWFSCDANGMAQEIMTNGPIEGSFTVYEDFMSYTGGVYQHTTGQELGGHAIKIIGWGVENSVPYWLVANSWGTTWGLSGFFKILRGSNEVGIESDNGAGTPIVKNQ